MPLHTQIIRDGEPIKVPWGGFHVAAMVIAASLDSGVGPYQDMEGAIKEGRELMERQGHIGISPGDAWQLMDYGVIGQTPLNSGDYTMKEDWAFIDNTDGEILEIKKGDVLSAGRW